MVMGQKKRRGDTGQITRGKGRARRGEVGGVTPKKTGGVAGGTNGRPRHARPSQQNQQGLYTFNAPVDISNVMLVDPSSGEPTKVGYRFTDSGEKVRVGKKSGKDIDG